MIRHAAELQLQVSPQPDDTTCGPTCLHAVYAYYEDQVPLARLIDEIPELPGGGTLAVVLACHALRRGYDATIYTYNLQLFDPTWFGEGVDISERLRRQRKVKRGRRMTLSTDAYLEYLELGGELRYEPLTARLVRKLLSAELPILTGLSATYLYDCARERQDAYDDVGGDPQGHFVVLSGYDREARDLKVADPLYDNPGFGAPYYRVGIERLLGAILLGVLTYDANLLVLTPRQRTP